MSLIPTPIRLESLEMGLQLCVFFHTSPLENHWSKSSPINLTICYFKLYSYRPLQKEQAWKVKMILHFEKFLVIQVEDRLRLQQEME